MLYIQKPNKTPKYSHFEKQVEKLKDLKFTKDQFQKARSSSKVQKIEEYFLRIGICLNNQTVKSISDGLYGKVCFIICNNYINEKLHLGIGPLNDAYMVGLTFHKLGYKIFYIINPLEKECEKFLKFFLKNTVTELIIYFTGRIAKASNKNNLHKFAMLFDDGHLFDGEIISLLNENKPQFRNKIVLISDSPYGEPICSFQSLPKQTADQIPNVIVLSAHRNSLSNDDKKATKYHGLFSFYLCKFLKQDPTISPKILEENINVGLNRFDESLHYESTIIENENYQLLE